MRKYNFESHFTFKALVFCLFLYPLLFMWQDGDVTDSGYFFITYQYFFENLFSGKTNSIIFLPELIAASWLKVFPGFGIMGLKFLFLLFFYPTLYVIYLILKDVGKSKNALLLYMICGVAFATRVGMFTFHYDVVSWLFLALTSLFLLKGFRSEGSLNFVIAGCCFTIAFLSRFPDIIFVFLLPVILLYQHVTKTEGFCKPAVVRAFRQYLFFISGFLVLLLLFLGGMGCFGLCSTYLENLGIVKSSMEGGNDNGHALSLILTKYKMELLTFIPHVFCVVLSMGVASLVYGASKKKMFHWPFIVFCVTLLLISKPFYASFTYSGNIKYLIPAICLLPLLSTVLKKDKTGVVTLLMLIMSLVQMAGTETGFFMKLAQGFMFLIPLALIVLGDKEQLSVGNVTLKTKPIVAVSLLFVLTFSLHARVGGIYNVDTGMDVRLRAVHPVDHKFMRGVLSTEKRAAYIVALCDSINAHMTENNSLFMYGHQPLFYYLTENRPPIESYWLGNNLVTVEVLFKSLEDSVNETGKWPLIVDTKEYTLRELGQQRLNTFLRKHDYSSVQDSVGFCIWKKN